ncbi:hypothetical protein BKA93DRAFT_516004 [Sparassis latifolia]
MALIPSRLGEPHCTKLWSKNDIQEDPSRQVKNMRHVHGRERMRRRLSCINNRCTQRRHDRWQWLEPQGAHPRFSCPSKQDQSCPFLLTFSPILPFFVFLCQLCPYIHGSCGASTISLTWKNNNPHHMTRQDKTRTRKMLLGNGCRGLLYSAGYSRDSMDRHWPCEPKSFWKGQGGEGDASQRCSQDSSAALHGDREERPQTLPYHGKSTRRMDMRPQHQLLVSAIDS